jgi:hypothetical protein
MEEAVRTPMSREVSRGAKKTSPHQAFLALKA